MSIKRFIQHKKRVVQSLLQSGSVKPENIKIVEDALAEPVPTSFSKALFNFTIDFELIWGNGDVDGVDHSYERRLKSAKSQAENFIPFVEMLNELGFDISWAILGKLASSDIEPPREASFSPKWAKNNWYDDKYKRLDPKLWNGEFYLNQIKENCPNHEILSHGHSHIDYSDISVSENIAKWDMENGIDSLSQFGFKVEGFVYPCNKHNFKKLLRLNGVEIIRGVDSKWSVLNDLVETPIGFWISPAFFTVKEIKRLIDIAVINKSFFHPWMHLLECDIKQGDIDKFYKPIFEYILELETEGKILNISFNNINKKMKG